MLKNYIKIALRNIIRHKGYSFINIAGLAVGMACCILILLWVQDELSYERFHENKDNIYRIIFEEGINNVKQAMGPIALAPSLKEKYPEIKNYSRLSSGYQKFLIKYNKRVFSEDIGFVDPSFFEIFTYHFLTGNPKTVFNDPYSLVITEKMAKKYFGEEEPLGKVLHLVSFTNNKVSFTVTGVLKNIPHNTHLQFNIFIPFSTLQKFFEWVDYEEWSDWSYFAYLQLQENSNIPEINKKMTTLVRENYREDIIDTFYLQPLSRIHLYSADFKRIWPGQGDIQYIYIFTIVAFFILLIACINFMNLSTAHFTLRSREVGLRKVLGANRNQLIQQFMGESVILAFISLLIALLLIEMFLPLYNNLIEKQLKIPYMDFTFILELLGIAFLTGIVSGSYPALFLSSFNPVQVFKNHKSSVLKGISFRKLLVIVQFSLSIIIIISTTTVFKQLTFVKNRKLGLDQENILYMPLQGRFSENYDIVKDKILKSHNILNVTASNQLITDVTRSATGAEFEGIEVCREIGVIFFTVDYNFLEVFNIGISQGRYFSKEFSTDAGNAVIINETLAKKIGKKPLIGKKLLNNNENRNRKIIGIVKDFHFRSLHDAIQPIQIVPFAESCNGYMYIKIKPNTASASIKHLENIWLKYRPNCAFEYHFLDSSIDQLYSAEKKMEKIFLYFTLLAIVISCLGLLGLTYFSIGQRTKEIGIRKVLGATVPNIIFLLTKDFTKWVLIGNIIAWPVAYYAMHRWLQNFAYRTNIGVSTFIFSAALALMIALATVSYQSIKAALANPVESLRYE